MSERVVIHRMVLGEAKPQKRHRHTKVGKFIRTYDPSAEDKETFAGILQREAPLTPINAPIFLQLTFYMRRPKSHYGTGSKSEMLKDNAPEWHTSKPDGDNLTKFVQDSLNKIYYRDDSLVCWIEVKKIYSERPRTEIAITVL